MNPQEVNSLIEEIKTKRVIIDNTTSSKKVLEVMSWLNAQSIWLGQNYPVEQGRAGSLRIARKVVKAEAFIGAKRMSPEEGQKPMTDKEAEAQSEIEGQDIAGKELSAEEFALQLQNLRSDIQELINIAKITIKVMSGENTNIM